MMELERLTTVYIDVEDRIRLAGVARDGERVVLWLTQRLLQRMLPVLLRWLEQQGQKAPHASVLQGFAQQAARAELTPQAPVAAEVGNAGWLVRAVDIAQKPKALRVTFSGAEEHTVSLTLAAKPLRQWLNILHDTYMKAGWRQEVWPEWMKEGAVRGVRPDVVVH